MRWIAPVILVLFVVGCANTPVTPARVWAQGVLTYNSVVASMTTVVNAGLVSGDKAIEFETYRAAASDALDKLAAMAAINNDDFRQADLDSLLDTLNSALDGMTVVLAKAKERET